jgi:GT2 family glycosyltransferase
LHAQPGLTRQRNAGAKEAAGDIIHFIDDDVDLDREYLEELDRVFCDRRNEDVAGAGGTVTNARRLARYAVLLKKAFLLNHDYGSGRLQPSGYSAFGYNRGFKKPVEVQILGGCCASYRRSVLEEYQFDENLPGYGLQEDVDFSWRVSRKYRLMFVPGAKLIHNQSRAGRAGPARYYYFYLYNHFYLSFKNLPRTLDHIAAIGYSHLAATLGIMCIAAYRGSGQPLLGALRAHAKMAADIMKGIFD